MNNLFFIVCFLFFLFNSLLVKATMNFDSLYPPDNGSPNYLDDNLAIHLYYGGPPPAISQTWDNGATGNIVLSKKPLFGLDYPVESFDVDSPRISGHDTHIVGIDPTDPLDDNSCYIVRVSGCAVVDNITEIPDFTCGGKAYLEINNYEWNFTTGTGVCDFDPTIISENASLLHLSPPNNATQFQKNQSLNLTFSKSVTANQGNFVLKKHSDNSVLETIPVTSPQVTGWGTSRIIINPSVNFIDNTQYYVNMDLTNFRSESDKNNWTFTIQKYPSVLSGSGL